MSESAIPGEGTKAPSFHLASDTGEKVRLSDFKGTPVALYFYPKDDTPGCTTEAQDFRDLAKDFKRLGVTLLGVSPDTVASHVKFVAKQTLNFALLSDPEHVTIEKYGLWVMKKLYGREFMGVQRATFLIDDNGKIVRVWPKVQVKGHAAEVLQAAKELVKG